MSAPPLDAPTMPTVVSRLPKFGSRPKHPTPPAAGGARLTNGFYHHPGPVGGAAPPPSFKQNRFLRAPSSFSGRCRDDGGKSGNAARSRSGAHQYYPHRPQGAPVMSQRDARKPTFTGRGRGFGLAASSLSSSAPSGVPKPRSSLLRPPQTCTRPTPGAGPGPGPGPGSRSGSPLHKQPPASRSCSSDSRGSAPSDQLTDNERLRSRSLTYPCPSGPSLSSLPRSRGLPRGGARGGRVAPTLLPPSAVRKPLLPSLGPASKPSGISYRLSRPSLMKQPRPLRMTSSDRRRNSIETPSSTENSPESSPEAPESDGLSAELVSQEEVSAVGEELEDMSLSSSSSLDHAHDHAHDHASQEYLDDFDTLGNGGVGLLLLSNQPEDDDSGLDQSCTRYDDDKASLNSVTRATELCFLDEGADWTGAERRLSRRRRSSQPDDHDQGGSSLDLSPSDSCGSAGTYMWDEEGLEPLGGAVPPPDSVHSSTASHHIGSFDSDLNSIDLLTRLDSCDLTEDDLMLDVDFPEDASLHSDGGLGGLGLSHMAQWRRRQLCWETQDLQDEGDLHGDQLREEPGNKRSDDTELLLDLSSTHLTPPAPPALGLDVEELAEDCSAVRSQLEELHRLLLQEDDADDDTLTTDTLSPDSIDSSGSSDSQVEALLQEVQQLRDELRSRDRTIAQLTVQLTVPTVTTRCRCQETTGKMDRCTQTSVRERESVASQTPWRERTSQVLHSSNQDQEPLTQAPPPPPPQAPPPPVDGVKAREDHGKQQRSLLPSKLRLPSPHISGSAPSPPPLRTSRLKAPSSSSCASSLSLFPKPKSQ